MVHVIRTNDFDSSLMDASCRELDGIAWEKSQEVYYVPMANRKPKKVQKGVLVKIIKHPKPSK